MAQSSDIQEQIAKRFKKLQPIDHVLLRPGRYIGSVKQKEADAWLLDENKKMVRRQAKWNPGLIKLFDEIISNSVDHSKRSEGKHLDTIKVEIDFKTGELSV